MSEEEYRPLQPGEFIQNEDGSRSTEYTSTIKADDRWMNIPTIWMTPKGHAERLSSDAATERAFEYMRRTGKQFPSYATTEESVEAAKARSAAGGVYQGPLAQDPPPSRRTARQQLNDPEWWGELGGAIKQDFASAREKLSKFIDDLGYAQRGGALNVLAGQPDPRAERAVSAAALATMGVGYAPVVGRFAAGGATAPMGTSRATLRANAGRTTTRSHPEEDLPNDIRPNEVVVDIPIASIEHGESAMPGGKLTWPGSQERIAEYASRPTDLPPISLMKNDPDDYFPPPSPYKWMVADGSHRLEAAKLRGDKTVRAAVLKQDAPKAPEKSLKGKGKTREEIEIQGGALNKNVGEKVGRILDDHNIEWEYHPNGGITAVEVFTKHGVPGTSKKYFGPNTTLGTVRNWLGY